MSMADSIIIFDFETTGLSPDMGDRAIEIGAVRIEKGQIVDQFQALMNPGSRISSFIEDYTGITNAMLRDADSCSNVMYRFADFISNSNMVAHNASFDKRFLDSELQNIGRRYSGEITCSLLASRRLLPSAPDYKLGTLVKFLCIENSGSFHRALYDAEMTAKVWVAMLSTVREHYSLADIPFSLIQKINKTPKKSVSKLLARIGNTSL
jgi:DNA polymerase-3 subunit epsilon